MKIHHLNCGSMRFPRHPLVCHVVLIEAPDGLVLIDTGFGLGDIADPGRLGGYRRVIRPALDPAETAARQIEALGYAASEVSHILLTHLDSDHAGGLADFPDATVHTTASEWDAARHPRSIVERGRYVAAQWAHGPNVETHDPAGERWEGFAAAKTLDHIASGLVMVALPGHTRGHVAYALENALPDGRTLLHAGDAFYGKVVISGEGQEAWTLKLQERAVAMDWSKVRMNHARLAELHRDRSDRILVVSAHDPALLAEARSLGGAA